MVFAIDPILKLFNLDEEITITNSMLKTVDPKTGKLIGFMGHYDIRVPLRERQLLDSVRNPDSAIDLLKQLRLNSNETKFINYLGNYDPVTATSNFNYKNEWYRHEKSHGEGSEYQWIR